MLVSKAELARKAYEAWERVRARELHLAEVRWEDLPRVFQDGWLEAVDTTLELARPAFW